MRANSLRPQSIRARMTLGFSLFATLLMAAVCGAFFQYTHRLEMHDAEARLALAKREILHEMEEADHSLAEALELVHENNANLRAADVALLFREKTGRTVAQSVRDNPRWPPVGNAWRTTSFQCGPYMVQVGVDWQSVEKALRKRTEFLLGLSVLVVALSSGGAWFLVGRTLSPIEDLARQAKSSSADNLSVQLASPSLDGEIVNLVATLNDLLARLGKTASLRGRFYAAASHELRTPLQALTGHIDVSLSRPRSAEEYHEALTEAKEQTRRLTSLVQGLLLLNQLEGSSSRPPSGLIDLAEICRRQVEALQPLAGERAIRIETSLPGQEPFDAPWNHVTILLRNLLENAVKYGDHGGVVRIQLSGGQVTICNDHKPDAQWTADKYFEPFFRPDVSRNSQTGGNGLGLAICKAFAEANSWTLDLNQHDTIVCAIVGFGHPATTEMTGNNAQ